MPQAGFPTPLGLDQSRLVHRLQSTISGRGRDCGLDQLATGMDHGLQSMMNQSSPQSMDQSMSGFWTGPGYTILSAAPDALFCQLKWPRTQFVTWILCSIIIFILVKWFLLEIPTGLLIPAGTQTRRYGYLPRCQCTGQTLPCNFTGTCPKGAGTRPVLPMACPNLW